MLVRVPKSASEFASSCANGGNSRLYKATLYGFWLVVCAIVVARVVVVQHGSLFDFAP